MGELASGSRGRRRPWAGVVPLSALLSVLSLLAALAACGGPSGGSSGGRDEERGDGGRAARAEIRELISRQAAAVTAGDERGYLAAVDPAPSAADYRAAQRAAFRNLRRLPLAEWSARAAKVEVRGGQADAEVRLRYRLRGYDRAPVTVTERLGLTRRDGDWAVTGERQGSPRQLWEQGPVTVRRGERSLVLAADVRTGAERRTLSRVAAAAERAVPAVSGAWPHPWARRVVVEVPAGLRGMGELLGGPAESYEGIAAVTQAESGGAGSAPADRIVVNPEAYGTLGGESRQIVLTHEAAHVATRAHTGDATPMWLSEGLADWFAFRDSGRTPRQAAPELARSVRQEREGGQGGEPGEQGEQGVPDALPMDEDFRFGGGAERLGRAYESGWLACRMIAGQWSEEQLTAFYTAVARGGEGGQRKAVEKALRDVLGIGMAEFTERWRAYLRAELA